MKPSICALATALFLTAGAVDAQDATQVVKVGDIRVSYAELGPDDGIPLVLVHGGGLTSRMWQWFALDAAAAGYHVYLPDTRNHGATDNPSGRFSYELAAEDLGGFIVALDLQKPVLMGYSDGGIIVQTYLLSHPDAAAAAVIGGATNKVAADDHYMAGMMAFYGYDQRGELPDSALDALAANAPDFAGRLQALHAMPGAPDRWRQLHKLAWPVWTTARVTPLADYAAIKAPVLVILGQHDEFFRPEDALALAEAMPKGEVAVIPGAHHPAFRDAAPIFNAIVLDFLNRSLAK